MRLRLADGHGHRRDNSTAETRKGVHAESVEQSRAFWPAGTKAIAVVKPSAAHSIRPLDSKESKTNKVRIEPEGAKGRKYQDEGRRGRKGESLSEDELPE